MTGIIPTLGRIVYYTIPSHVAQDINRRRQHAAENIYYHRWKKNGAMVHVGNPVSEGQIVPAMVVAVWGNTPGSAVNLKLFLDGSDDYWVTSTGVEPEVKDNLGNEVHVPGRYHWMPYQKAVASGQIAPVAHAAPEQVLRDPGATHPIIDPGRQF